MTDLVIFDAAQPDASYLENSNYEKSLSEPGLDGRQLYLAYATRDSLRSESPLSQVFWSSDGQPCLIPSHAPVQAD